MSSSNSSALAESAQPSSALPPDEWNRTDVPYPADECLHELTARQAAATPDRIALKFGSVSLTYRELDQRANRLARFLRGLGVGPNTLVGVSAFRSIEMVVALFGILKAGGAYVPIDPEYPADRIGFMLQDSGVKLVLTHERVKSLLPPTAARLLCLDTEWASVAGCSAEPLERTTTAADLAYMIYTSGSTGRPKGALNSHRGICNRLRWMQDRYQITAADVVLQKTPFSFDVSVWEFFWPLLSGGRLMIAEPGGHQDPAYLARVIDEEKVTILHFVPSMLRAFLAEPAAGGCRSLRHVICSGEALTHDLQEKFFARFSCELHNLYGPTEAAVDVTHWTCQRDSRSPIVPIGRPVANTRMYVLNESLQPVPIGAEGELFIGGVQVGRGYHNRPELTAEKFIRDPFSSDPDARLYRTGDLARWLPDGNLDYLGRIDFQVKIRGFRIELGEIESVLAQHPSVKQAVVTADQPADGERRLVAYLCARDGAPATVNSLREHLLARLPEYMVPAWFVWLDQIPLSPNGKVDRKALPAPTRARPLLAQPFAEARQPLEKQLVALWQTVIPLDEIGIDDRFFELGGNSLGLARVHAELQKQLGRDIPIATLFEHITVRTLAAHLGAAPAQGNAVDALQERARRQREALLRRRPAGR
jgi:amino acid adenylation domain-containing protein